MNQASDNQAVQKPGETPEADKKKASKVRFGLRLKFSLAIIFLVTVVVMSISGYIIWRESNLLGDQIFQFVERELVHLGKTAQTAIGYDELALNDSVNDLKKISYLKYAYVLNSEDRILMYFDKRGKRDISAPLEDSFKRDLSDRGGKMKSVMLEGKDPDGGKIYDFSQPVLSKVDSKKIGYVIIGLSDSIIRDEIRNLINVIIPISLSFLGLSILASIILASITINPIRKLSEGVAIIGKGNLDYRIELKTSDELGQLASEFNEMTALIKDAKEQEVEQRILDEQLETAKDIQEGLNPMGYYDKNGIQIKGYTRAAKGVGGDYFDYLDIDDHRVGCLLSDVSGKGVPASLVMVMIRTVFTSYVSQKNIDAAQVVRAINNSLSADFAIDKFATLMFYIYDRQTEKVTFCNAGHGPLYVYRAGKDYCTKTQLDGVPIGIMDDVDYDHAQVALNPGDIIFTYSDGVTEMRNPQREEYGLSRVQKMIIENHHLPANELLDAVIGDVEKFRETQPPHDDTTLLIFKRES